MKIMAKKDYTNWDRKELIKEIDQLRKRKKYGLVWEDKPENVVEQCKTELPVLEEVKGKEIKTDSDKPMNLLIEGDNYHALSVLNYTRGITYPFCRPKSPRTVTSRLAEEPSFAPCSTRSLPVTHQAARYDPRWE